MNLESKDDIPFQQHETIASVKPDVESQLTPTIEAFPVPEPPITVAYIPPRTTPIIYVPPEIPPDDRDSFTWCAIVGFIFSWIPLIGFATFIFNADAPAGSARRSFSQMACFVSMLVVIFNIFFWPWY